MSAPLSAFQLGFLPWKVKRRQETLWSDRPTDIKEVDDPLIEVELALPALADRITGQFEQQLQKLRQRLEERHRYIAGENVARYFALLKTETGERRRERYHDYLAGETNHQFREWQREDWNNLRDLLAAAVTGDQRLLGYYEMGDHLGEATHLATPASGPQSKRDRDYILAGMKRLPLREQREIEPFFLPTSLGLFGLARRMEKLGRFLKDHEGDLGARPKWDGRTLTYRGRSEQVRIQDKSVMTVILDEGEGQGWPDAIRLSAKLMGNKRSVANAIHYFEREHKLLEFSVNGNRVLWGPPGTLKRRRTARGPRSA
jgi:hypothetical protein